MEVTSIDNLIQISDQFMRANNQQVWYRGQAKSSWHLLPGVKRPPYNKPQHEQFMATNFYTEVARRIQKLPFDKVGWICLMQHYGLPTRLLDWSESPLIALYFAVFEEEYKDDDASIWLLAPIALNAAQGYKKYLPPMDYPAVQDCIEPAFDLHKTAPTKYLACRTVENDLRMYVQQSVFTIHESSKPLDEAFSKKHFIQQFNIPASKKEKLKSQLELLGFKQSTIFPDVEHVASEIKHTFMI